MFLLDSDLEVEAHSRYSLCLLAVCSWHFPLASFIPLAKKCIIFCWLVLSLLSMQFLQSDTLMFVSQETWSNRTLNPEHFRPGFLTFFVQGLPYNTLVGIIFREIENLQF